jgi:hypothetical protein
MVVLKTDKADIEKAKLECDVFVNHRSRLDFSKLLSFCRILTLICHPDDRKDDK